MAWKITVSHRHPRGKFRRDGREFTAVPTYLEELTPGLEAELKDPKQSYLVIEQVAGAEAEQAQVTALKAAGLADSTEDLIEDLEGKSMKELRALATEVGLPAPVGTRKADLIATLQAKLAAKAEAAE